MALPARPYDPLYDTTYTVSGARDHYRQQTVAGGFMIERAPEYPNMFSELPHFPATTFRLKNSDKVPGCVDRSFQPEFRDPVDLELRSQAQMVAGQQRFKYFRRPMLAAGQAQAPVLIRQAAMTPPAPQPPPVPEPASKTVGTQSDYRESEAQTMPWAPPVKLPETGTVKQAYLSSRYHCQGPELLQLQGMTFGDGLPPGLAEVTRIEKMRAKRAFEATLPPLNDLEQLPVRQKMIEEWEAREWEEREQEILGVQDERLELIDQALQVREEEIDGDAAARVEARKQAVLADKAPAFAAVQANRIKTMRQLIEARKYVESHRKLVKPSMVEKYANYGSSTYAPVQRDGRFPESKPQGKVIETEGFQPVTLQGINELQAFLPAKMLVPKAVKPDALQPAKPDYNQRREAAVQKDLKAINQLLDTARSTKGLGIGDCWPAPLKEDEAALVANGALPLTKTVSMTGALPSGLGAPGRGSVSPSGKSRSKSRRSVVRAVERPDSPELPPPAHLGPGADKAAAAVLLQRLLRGRAAQNLMYEGKVRRAALIEELLLEGSPQACSSRPEDRHPVVSQLDAVLGGVIARLAVALSTQEPQQRAALLQEAMQATAAATLGSPAELGDVAAALRTVVTPASRASTPLQAARVEGDFPSQAVVPVATPPAAAAAPAPAAVPEAAATAAPEPAAAEPAPATALDAAMPSEAEAAPAVPETPDGEAAAQHQQQRESAGELQEPQQQQQQQQQPPEVAHADSLPRPGSGGRQHSAGPEATDPTAAAAADEDQQAAHAAGSAAAPAGQAAADADNGAEQGVHQPAEPAQQAAELVEADEKAVAAAVQIQATYKGYRARKEVAAMKTGNTDAQVDAAGQAAAADGDADAAEGPAAHADGASAAAAAADAVGAPAESAEKATGPTPAKAAQQGEEEAPGVAGERDAPQTAGGPAAAADSTAPAAADAIAAAGVAPGEEALPAGEDAAAPQSAAVDEQPAEQPDATAPADEAAAGGGGGADGAQRTGPEVAEPEAAADADAADDAAAAQEAAADAGPGEPGAAEPGEDPAAAAAAVDASEAGTAAAEGVAAGADEALTASGDGADASAAHDGDQPATEPSADEAAQPDFEAALATEATLGDVVGKAVVEDEVSEQAVAEQEAAPLAPEATLGAEGGMGSYEEAGAADQGEGEGPEVGSEQQPEAQAQEGAAGADEDAVPDLGAAAAAGDPAAAAAAGQEGAPAQEGAEHV